jgi:hypothetical protein
VSIDPPSFTLEQNKVAFMEIRPRPISGGSPTGWYADVRVTEAFFPGVDLVLDTWVICAP